LRAHVARPYDGGFSYRKHNFKYPNVATEVASFFPLALLDNFQLARRNLGKLNNRRKFCNFISEIFALNRRRTKILQR